MNKIPCPYCDATYKPVEKLIGKSVACKKCGSRFQFVPPKVVARSKPRPQVAASGDSLPKAKSRAARLRESKERESKKKKDKNERKFIPTWVAALVGLVGVSILATGFFFIAKTVLRNNDVIRSRIAICSNEGQAVPGVIIGENPDSLFLMCRPSASAKPDLWKVEFEDSKGVSHKGIRQGVFLDRLVLRVNKTESTPDDLDFQLPDLKRGDTISAVVLDVTKEQNGNATLERIPCKIFIDKIPSNGKFGLKTEQVTRISGAAFVLFRKSGKVAVFRVDDQFLAGGANGIIIDEWITNDRSGKKAAPDADVEKKIAAQNPRTEVEKTIDRTPVVDHVYLYPTPQPDRNPTLVMRVEISNPFEEFENPRVVLSTPRGYEGAFPEQSEFPLTRRDTDTPETIEGKPIKSNSRLTTNPIQLPAIEGRFMIEVLVDIGGSTQSIYKNNRALRDLWFNPDNKRQNWTPRSVGLFYDPWTNRKQIADETDKMAVLVGNPNEYDSRPAEVLDLEFFKSEDNLHQGQSASLELAGERDRPKDEPTYLLGDAIKLLFDSQGDFIHRVAANGIEQIDRDSGNIKLRRQFSNVKNAIQAGKHLVVHFDQSNDVLILNAETYEAKARLHMPRPVRNLFGNQAQTEFYVASSGCWWQCNFEQNQYSLKQKLPMNGLTCDGKLFWSGGIFTTSLPSVCVQEIAKARLLGTSSGDSTFVNFFLDASLPMKGRAGGFGRGGAGMGMMGQGERAGKFPGNAVAIVDATNPNNNKVIPVAEGMPPFLNFVAHSAQHDLIFSAFQKTLYVSNIQSELLETIKFEEAITNLQIDAEGEEVVIGTSKRVDILPVASFLPVRN